MPSDLAAALSNSFVRIPNPSPLGRVAIEETAVQPTFAPGLKVIVYDEEMEVNATLEYDNENTVWLARPDRSSRRDLPYP